VLPEKSFRDTLFDAGLLIASGVDGIYGRSGDFEAVVDGIDGLISRDGNMPGAEVVRFPPAMPRKVMETSGYLKGFPHLAGTVHCFCGDSRAHRTLLQCLDAGEDWTGQQECVDLALTPAACYPVYPMIAARGVVKAAGNIVDVSSYCFRHEPSLEPTRMQLFRMREFVFIGAPEDVKAFRDMWAERGRKIIGGLGLPVTIDVANDPFFGRAGKIMAESQREQALKYELLVPVNSAENLTACLSFNYHMDHFSEIWNLRMDDGTLAHTACVGFGFERLALALFRHHGFDRLNWPETVRTALWPA